MASLPSTEVEYERDHIHESQRAACYGVTIVFFILAIISGCLRLLSRRRQRASYGLDDYLAAGGIVRSLSLSCGDLAHYIQIAVIPFIAATLGGEPIIFCFLLGKPLFVHHLHYPRQVVRTCSYIPDIWQYQSRNKGLHHFSCYLGMLMGYCIVLCLWIPMPTVLAKLESDGPMRSQHTVGILSLHLECRP
ncbi:conserved hypothetical protein [Talaromyces stipitatus ATCC 10500]|uniref:Uncharacterized protein n=1 Tax=Talaromyces stipitatus (strain ATCC 10500 / CBS 375.48 / QM 6759 / NRRL 1006) TaxID=441959 RepID=B8MSU3_TALSN|nr:uncharacterized protein TSTA_000630 [Talaromyces stipitatus ATCC 10500]EED11986.1 conserved hypothetical protein [Talaromyces stipitatus ATCC 10500]